MKILLTQAPCAIRFDVNFMNDKIRCKNVNKVKLEMNLEVFWIKNLHEIMQYKY